MCDIFGVNDFGYATQVQTKLLIEVLGITPHLFVWNQLS